MQLLYTSTSPFARKVRIAAMELNLDKRMTLVEVDPWTDRSLRTMNPLSKVPTLVADDGTVLFESTVICDYLDAQGTRRRLFPADGPFRWKTLRLQGLADGAMTAAGRLFADERRPANERSETMLTRFAEARDAVLDKLEQEDLREEPLIGEIAVAAFLGYLDFRWNNRDWRRYRPRLAAWFAHFSTRPSMIGTHHALPNENH
ncbi:MAG: glutathione S-transferase N-terminal domain-containing protein [Betaproteobacteria bacterium]|nr:glutathione S-transferase N-terminal domain-containing protein [Betaproteobacteria bacterium]